MAAFGSTEKYSYTATPRESQQTDAAATDAATSPVETEDIKLIGQALEKALYVHTGTSLSEGKKPSQPRKNLAATGVQSKGATLKASAASKGNESTNRTTLKSASLNRRGQRKPGTSSTHGTRSSAVSDVIQTHPAPSAGKNVQRSTSASKGARRSVPRDEDLAKASAVTSPWTDTEDTGDDHQPRRTQCEQMAQWKSLWVKQNRMWDKVMATQRKPVPERIRFMERMSATFPKDWPRDSPDQISGLLGSLTHQTDELVRQSQQTLEPSTDAGMKDSCIPLESLQITAAELQNVAEQAKQEWEAWDRWRPEGGRLCSAGATGYEAMAGRLPVTITYTSEAELRELETLRMRVALLQQEMSLQQALLDALSPQLASIISSCPNRSVLRDLYSLLGEGGQRFPAIVLDSEPD
ncbi:uncharacterized protein LOC129171035 isoform X2 [Dunckerocampus dactyliophorus]|uniref:uncharacterized protein LOC129171035 isoform X2 n=1 Tax=Dunckerocampus dactyliophorus TaxID=161453 RepID=UPI0024071348|nr:uncharacterized protein LOC129171035 isoform X2 [Dunckerocampus dactyliophorus]XP_054615309.1 uncharacterized protein LOC129171035 isoform X2 [Dunckerocampus dactyliophorus]